MLKRKYLDKDVFQAARDRIKKIFSHGVKVRFNFSGGKDSLVLADLILKLARSGEIDKELLEVVFVDEEAMYDDVIEHCKRWRKKFMLEGIPFYWYCVEVKHYNCLNSLQSDESFITWDRHKKKDWVRPMPRFAITDDPYLLPRKDTYQEWLDRKNKHEGAFVIMGVRVYESVQRLQYFTKRKRMLMNNLNFMPIYETKDEDIWLYILKNNLAYPETYKHMYQVGVSRGNLRISQFFSNDTARQLVHMQEIYPDLMERVKKREPNAYLISLYWDTGLFGRSSKNRRKLEKEKKDEVNWRNKFYELVKNPEKLPNHAQRDLLDKFRKLVLQMGHLMDDRDYRKIVEAIHAGDPKHRTYRGIMNKLAVKRKKMAKEM